MLGNTVWQFLKKKNQQHGITIWSSNSNSGYISERTESRDTHTHMPVFIAALFIIAKRWQQTKCPQVDEIWWRIFSIKKERNSDTCYNMDGPCRNHAKWKKSVTKRQTVRRIPLIWDTSVCVFKSLQSCQSLCYPMDCSLPGSSVYGDSPDENTGVGFHSVLQGIFPTQGLNPGTAFQADYLPLSHRGSPWDT